MLSVCCWLIATMHARPDILYVTVVLAKYNPEPKQIKAVHIFKYVKGSLDRGITYSAKGCQVIEIYSDTDYGNSSTQDASIK